MYNIKLTCIYCRFMSYLEFFPFARFMGEAAAPLELGELLSSRVYQGDVPHGDHRPVMVLPGVGGSDMQLNLMTDWLTRIDYDVSPSGIGFNAGDVEPHVQAVENRLEKSVKEKGQKHALIGFSAGGFYALDIAARRPELVDEIILLGTPVNDDLRTNIAWYGQLFQANNILTSPVGKRTPGDVPKDIKITCIYGNNDQFITNRQSFYSPRVTTVVVSSSHTGMPQNVDVYRNIATVLARKTENK